MGYPLGALASVIAVLALDLVVLRSRLLARRTYWIGYGICLFFQAIVDGWLTKLTAPIVIYAPAHFLGVRFPWDVPIEDFAFGWAMLHLSLALWEHGHDPIADAVPRAAPVVRLGSARRTLEDR